MRLPGATTAAFVIGEHPPNFTIVGITEFQARRRRHARDAMGRQHM